jgi:HEPN domain-containing protein
MENSVSNPLAWTFFADKDISIAELAVDNEELSGEVVFHCQQAVEKYISVFFQIILCQQLKKPRVI